MRLLLCTIMALLITSTLTAAAKASTDKLANTYGGTYEWLMQKGKKSPVVCTIGEAKADGSRDVSFKAQYQGRINNYKGTIKQDAKSQAWTGRAKGGNYVYDMKGTIDKGIFAAQFFYVAGVGNAIKKGQLHGTFSMELGKDTLKKRKKPSKKRR